MDYAASFFEGRTSNWSYGTMKNFSTISGPVRYHLQRVCFLSLSPPLLIYLPLHSLFLCLFGVFSSVLFFLSQLLVCVD